MCVARLDTFRTCVRLSFAGVGAEGELEALVTLSYLHEPFILYTVVGYYLGEELYPFVQEICGVLLGCEAYFQEVWFGNYFLFLSLGCHFFPSISDAMASICLSRI